MINAGKKDHVKKLVQWSLAYKHLGRKYLIFRVNNQEYWYRETQLLHFMKQHLR